MPTLLQKLFAGSGARRTHAAWLKAAGRILEVTAEADGLAAAAPEVLRALGTSLGVPFATLWVADANARRLRFMDAWAAPRFPDRRLAEDLRAQDLAPGEGLAGRALTTRRPVLVPSLDLLEATGPAPRARAAGLVAGLGFPILHGEALYGAVELYATAPFPAEEGLLEAAANLGMVLGQFATRRRALRDLAQREAELADLFDHAPVPMHAADATGRIVRANAAELALLGYAADAYVGRRAAEFHVDPEVPAAMLERLRAGADVVEQDAWLRCQDGRTLRAHLQWCAARREGQIVQVRSFARDVTVERANQARLGEIERRFQGLVDGARDCAIVALDAEGRITSWNAGAERIFGWGEAEALGQPYARTHPEDDRAEGVPERLLRAALDEGEVRHDGWRPRGGSRFWAETTLTTVRRADGTPIEVLAVVRDLTERRRLEELRLRTGDLEEANRAVVYGSQAQEEMLHEAERASSSAAGEVRARVQALEAALAEGRRPAADDLTALARGLDSLEHTLREGTRAGLAAVRHVDLQPTAIDPLRLAVDTCELLRPSATARLVRLEVDVTPELTEMVTDPRRLRQVLTNLVQHAITSSRDRGRVAVRLLAEGPHDVRIEVEDTGLGLKPEEVPHAFDPPEAPRAPAEPGARLVGRGGAGARPVRSLGLAAVKRIVEAQGGRVGVQSTLGRGSVHVAVLPRRPRASGRQEEPTPSTPQRVLIVSPEASLRAPLGWSLGNAGHRVEFADGAEPALALARRERFDVVAVELARPGQDPLAFLHDLRREGASQGLAQVLALVRSGPAAYAALAVHDVLPRPCPAERLAAALERVQAPRDRSVPVLVVDGDLEALRRTERLLVQLGYAVTAEPDGDAALRTAAGQRHGALVLGLFPLGMDAFELLGHLRRPGAALAPPVLLLVPPEVASSEAPPALRQAATAARERSGGDGGARSALGALRVSHRGPDPV